MKMACESSMLFFRLKNLDRVLIQVNLISIKSYWLIILVNYFRCVISILVQFPKLPKLPKRR